MIRSRVIGCGVYLPENVVTNDELAKRVDTSDEWIRERTGIRERRIAVEGENDVPSCRRSGARGAARCRHRCR